MAGFFGSGSGETAPLVVLAVVVLILLIGMVSSVVSLRLAVRAIRLDGDSVLAKITFGLDCVSLLFAVLVGGWILSDFVG